MPPRQCPTCGYRYGRTAQQCVLDGSALVAADDPLRGVLLNGRYRLGEELGAGAMGVVYEALDARTGDTVAVKVPDATSLRGPLRERFLREGRVGLAVRHPHVVATLDVGCDRDTHYLVMERLHGESLGDALTRGPLPVEHARGYARQIADALAALHQRGVVHRDLKPSNVFLVARDAPDRCVRVLDLGIAHVADEDPLTLSHAVMGTARAMSPEQCRGRPATAASDLYALGTVLFEMLTGRPVFEGPDLAVRRAHHALPPPRVRDLRPDAPAELDALVDALLAKDPALRPPDAARVRDALDALRDDPQGTVAVAAFTAPVTYPVNLPAPLDPERVALARTHLDAVCLRWQALAPTLDALAKLHALDVALAAHTRALADARDDEARRRAELSLAETSDARRIIADALTHAGTTADALRPHLDAALADARALADAIGSLRGR